MRRYFALALFFWLAAVLGAGAQSLDDQYVQIFNTIQEGDTLSATQPGKALAKYADAQAALQRIQRGSPDWNAKIVSFRLTYLANKIAELSSGTSATNAPSPAPTPAAPQPNALVSPAPTNVPVVPSTSAPPAAASSAPNTTEMEQQIRSFKEQVRQLQADRIMMEAKLKEALSIQPEADPGEIARAQDKLKALQKENDLLKTSIETQKTKSAPVIDPKVLQQTQADLAEANRQLAQQKDVVSRLTVERDALLARPKTATPATADLAALQAENQLLKQRLSAASANTASAQSAGKPDEAKQLAQANAELASLKSDKELLRLEKAALENRLKQYTTNVATSSVLAHEGSADDSVRIRQLERERDQLQKKLDAANKSLYGRKGSATASKVDELELELSAARARLEVFEARQVPYTSEELALMKPPEAKLAEATPKSTKRPAKDLPAGSSKLVVEAQTWFASHQYDKAENAYAQVVKLDPKNVPALANYAAVQIEAGHMAEAEKSVRAALAEDPEDAFSLYVLGILKFREAKYDDSLDALSRAAKLDPDNAEIENYLGLALSEKGMRGPAENALRKAIQLQPNYGGAHYNLAIIYLSQQPPALQLARWHYDKAVATGHPRNEELERKMDKK